MINNNFPTPSPDRRKLSNNPNLTNFNHQQSTEHNPFKNSNTISSSNQMNISFTKKEKEEFDKTNNLTLVKLKHIEDMRKTILTFKLLNDKSMFMPSNAKNPSINKCNIILFGPSGSGKSSFIRSMYRALYNNSFLPPEAMNKLIIKNQYQNEGTLNFTRLHLKEENENSSGIILCDTRGHIRMNEDEKQQFKILLEKNIKDNVMIEQRKERNPFEFWEFWKSKSELFPKEIFNSTESGLDSIPHGVVFVFDGSSDEVIDKMDERFYKDLVNMSKRKGYLQVHVVLTRIDIFEKIVNERNRNLGSTERSTQINTLKDEKIEKVIDILGVNRSDVHFIENYHSESLKENSHEIDYHLLKTMSDIINACENFILLYLNKSETCFATCFGGGK